MSDSNGFPRGWKFHSDSGDADGEIFLGRFTGVIEQGETKDYGAKPVARFIHEETGEERSIWLFTQVILDKMVKLAPETGELVEIKYLGKKKSKSSTRTYANYSVTAPEREVKNMSWAELGTPEYEDEDE